MNICKWCGKQPATQEDYDEAEAGGREDHVCWRWWSDYSDCHDIEQKLVNLTPLMRDTILAWEASINATTSEETEDLYVKAAHMRKRVMDVLKDLPGGGGAVEKPRITPLPSAAGDLVDDWNERMSQGFDIGKARPDNPIKGQDGLPNDKTEIVSGIMDGFSQPLPNLDHLVDRRPRKLPMTAEQMDAFLANAIQAPSIDDDLDEPLGKACSIDNPGCDSCS